MTTRDKAYTLANKAINNPTLLNKLDDDTMIKFAIGVSRYDIHKAFQLMDLKYPTVKPARMIEFWRAVGILTPEENYL
jgi:hypothetical protein